MALSNRFQPPAAGADVTASLSQVSAVVDQLALLAQYKPAQESVVFVPAASFRHLVVVGGMNVVIPTADSSNFAQRITLLVDAHNGPCRIRAVTGTINDATFTTLLTGYSSLIELVSDGQGQWFTDRESGFPIAGAHLIYSGNTLDVNTAASFTWTGDWNLNNRIRLTGKFSTTLAAQADNLAIGAVSVVDILLTGAQNISGMVPDGDGHLVWLQNRDSTLGDTLTILHDVTSTAANRFVCPGLANLVLRARSAVWCRYDAGPSRWIIATP